MGQKDNGCCMSDVDLQPKLRRRIPELSRFCLDSTCSCYTCQHSKLPQPTIANHPSPTILPHFVLHQTNHVLLNSSGMHSLHPHSRSHRLTTTTTWHNTQMAARTVTRAVRGAATTSVRHWSAARSAGAEVVTRAAAPTVLPWLAAAAAAATAAGVACADSERDTVVASNWEKRQVCEQSCKRAPPRSWHSQQHP